MNHLSAALAGVVRDEFDGAEHLWISDYVNNARATDRGVAVRCLKCNAVHRVTLESIEASYMLGHRSDRYATVLDGVRSFVRDHQHPAPRPMTLEERRRAREVRVHRRGALRCGSGTGGRR